MNFRELTPWNRGSRARATLANDQNPFLALHREVNRLFDDVFHGLDAPTIGGLGSWTTGWPTIEISDGEKEIRVVAEVPGLDAKDVEVLFEDGVLILRGEKRSETEDKDRQFSERFYGRFERRIPLGTDVEQERIDANFKNGLLTITAPKSARASERRRRIAVQSVA